MDATYFCVASIFLLTCVNKLGGVNFSSTFVAAYDAASILYREKQSEYVIELFYLLHHLIAIAVRYLEKCTNTLIIILKTDL